MSNHTDSAKDTETTKNTVRVESPYRPLPRQARKELKANYEIVEWIDSDETGRNGGVILTERPSEELLERFELSVIRDPDLIYETDSDEIVEIYTNPPKILTDGVEAKGLPIRQAVDIAESTERFTRIEGDPEPILSR